MTLIQVEIHLTPKNQQTILITYLYIYKIVGQWFAGTVYSNPLRLSIVQQIEPNRKSLFIMGEMKMFGVFFANLWFAVIFFILNNFPHNFLFQEER